MGEITGVAWCDSTFNGWIGCEKVSEACKYCYAETSTPTRVARSKGLELWGGNAARRRTSEHNWNDPLRWNRRALADREIAESEGRAWRRPRVFAFSLADVFEDRRDLDPWRRDFFTLIEATPELDWLLLTKRADRVLALVPADWRSRFPRNVWMGTTAETQARADERVPALLEIPASVRFVSIEPQLEAIDLTEYLDPAALPCGEGPEAFLALVICGGERRTTGAAARPFAAAWGLELLRECEASDTPFFMKQTGDVLIAPEWFTWRELPMGPGSTLIGHWQIRAANAESAGEILGRAHAGTRSFQWHTWDTTGVGGENSEADTLPEAKAGVVAALRRQGLKAPGLWYAVNPIARGGDDPAAWDKALRVREFPTPDHQSLEETIPRRRSKS